MVIGQSEDRDTPRCPAVLRHHCRVWDPIRATHLGQRSTDRTTQAGHMTATDQTTHRSCTRPCETGAVHIWAPACAGEAGLNERPHGPVKRANESER